MTAKNVKRVVVKIGTNVLTTESGELDLSVIQSTVNQIAELKKEGISVILVSSGAVGAGKSLYKLTKTTDETIQRQVYSSIGQVKLMNIYSEMFLKHQLYCAQVLATKEDFLGTEHYKNMKNCFKGLLNDQVIPIVNENDVVSLKELMFTDNDELAGLTAFLIKADALLLLTNVDGLYTGNPELPTSELIKEVVIGENDEEVENYILSAKSTGGRGGMRSKFDTARRCAEKGINTFILNGKQTNGIVKTLHGENLGTRFSS